MSRSKHTETKFFILYIQTYISLNRTINISCYCPEKNVMYSDICSQVFEDAGADCSRTQPFFQETPSKCYFILS